MAPINDDDVGKNCAFQIGERLTEMLIDAPTERVRFVYLDHDGGVLGHGVVESQHPRLVQLLMRDVTRDALHLNAAAVIMAHNHPSGDPTPSRQDIDVTRRLWTVLDAINVRLLDHFVVATGGTVSLRAAGLL